LPAGGTASAGSGAGGRSVTEWGGEPVIRKEGVEVRLWRRRPAEVTVRLAAVSGREAGGKATWGWVAEEGGRVVRGACAAGHGAVPRVAGYRPRVVVCAGDGLLVRQFGGLAPVPAEVLGGWPGRSGRWRRRGARLRGSLRGVRGAGGCCRADRGWIERVPVRERAGIVCAPGAAGELLAAAPSRVAGRGWSAGAPGCPAVARGGWRGRLEAGSFRAGLSGC
jgi:hypothetical protein